MVNFQSNLERVRKTRSPHVCFIFNEAQSEKRFIPVKDGFGEAALAALALLLHQLLLCDSSC